jgi:hypothetical protein
MIQDITKIYQGKNIAEDHQSIEKIEDLGKCYK